MAGTSVTQRDYSGEFLYEGGVLKRKRNGNAKLRIGNIEKGILSDGINLLEDSQVWSTDDVSIEGFQDFIVQYSDMIGREMGGYYYTEIGGTDLKYINSGKGKNNTHTMSYPGADIFRVRRDLYGKVEVHTNWHTHPSTWIVDVGHQTKIMSSKQSKNRKEYIVL